MSLVQHVTAVEGVDRESEEPDTASLVLGRRPSLTLSYDPIPSAAQLVEKLPPVGAYVVSLKHRIGMCAGATTA